MNIDLSIFPQEAGVYLMKDTKGIVLYIGKAKNLRNRLRQYFSSSGDSRAMIPFLTQKVESIDTILTLGEKEALLLENTLIKKHKPKYNALLKDDKTHLNLWINPKEPWPKLLLLRSKGKPHGKGFYFGPYTNALAARKTFDLLSHIFPLRQCSDAEFKRRTRPCLLYDMKRCVAPCVGKCSKKEYQDLVDGAVDFLKGKDKTILKKLYADMKTASKNLEFEKAAILWKTITQAEHVLASQKTVINLSAKDLDIIGLYREGTDAVLVKMLFREGKLCDSEKFSFSECLQEDEELLTTFILQHYGNLQLFPQEILFPLPLPDKKPLEEILQEETGKKISLRDTPKRKFFKDLAKMALNNAKSIFAQEKELSSSSERLLLDLQEKLHLTRYPKVIECFDTSNSSGSDLVACKVRFIDGKKDRAGKRLFRIKGIDKPDDYAALHQTLSRRFSKQEDDFPDLILIDGGKGQLNIALEVLRDLNIISIDVASISKENARHDKGLSAEKLFIPSSPEAIFLDKRSPLLFFLQNIRDEAHRAAISYHRLKRENRLISSSLDEIPGIGPKKKKALLTHFGSVAKITQASEEELAAVPGITKKDILTLFHHR